MKLSELATAKQVSPELTAKFRILHMKMDEGQKIMAMAMEAAMTAAVNVNTALEVEHDALRAELEVEIGQASAGWAIDTVEGWAADRREVDIAAHRHAQHG